ncbi:outer membrane protein assembly factor BamA [Candidatus Protochlamydia phocaeensis]|uniref:outer membrane protein assembly factor BamA n=1 Tax=Candidatus Protochlamydia phocaeensis TaxID=1414722 RepID=UPI0009ADC5C1|nr:outer membrane protein assembly factor BamA [Candidatus Protochlamydia phocaeensis]
MTKKIFFVFHFFCLIFFQFASAQVLQYENQTIESVDIIVHTRTGTISDNNAIATRLGTKQGGFFSQADFDEDLKTLSQDYDRVEPTIETDEEHVHVTIHLWPKPTIRTIHWHGNHRVSTNRLQKELGIGCFAVYERQAFNEAFHKLKAYYIRKGFFEAHLDYHVELNSETNEVDITIDIHEGRSGKIQEIEFVNFTDKEQSEILHQMITKKYNIFMSWFTQEGTYNEDAIQQDKLIITNYLQNEGFADAQVDITVMESCKTDRIIVTVIADKGERYYFGRLSFEGNQVICDEEIDRLFLIRDGMPFSLEDLRDTLERLTDAYGRIGYVDAFIDFEPELVEGEHRYNVHFKIEEGEQFRVGLIRVFGNIATKTSVILHETLLVPGEIFNVLKLKASEQRLINIGYFKNVNVYIVKGTESSLGSDYRDVYIEVEETNTGQFSAFLGYSSTEEIFGGINITERNFNHEGFYYFWRDGLRALRGGGEYAQLSTQIGQKSRNYTFSWTKPYFMDSNWTIGCDLSKSSTRYISKEYDLETVALMLRAQYNVNQFLRLGIQYRLKNGSVNLHHGGSHISQLEHDANIHGLISAIGASLSYDSTNHPIKPSQGFRSKLLIEYAGLGGDHSFFSLGYLNSYYLGIGSRMILRYRADFRFIQPLGDTTFDSLPLDERIFLGGDFNVRGYRPYRLGPQYKHAHDHIPRGGISMQLYSVELSRRITQDFELFAFFDAGHLSQDTWEFGRMSVAVGYGTRFKLIDSVPPITLGMGYPLNPRNRSEVKKFFLSFGGNF